MQKTILSVQKHYKLKNKQAFEKSGETCSDLIYYFFQKE